MLAAGGAQGDHAIERLEFELDRGIVSGVHVGVQALAVYRFGL